MQMIFWQFWLFFVFKLVVILLLVGHGSEAFLPTSPPWPEPQERAGWTIVNKERTLSSVEMDSSVHALYTCQHGMPRNKVQPPPLRTLWFRDRADVHMST